jgi:hypothetical protein
MTFAYWPFLPRLPLADTQYQEDYNMFVWRAIRVLMWALGRLIV